MLKGNAIAASLVAALLCYRATADEDVTRRSARDMYSYVLERRSIVKCYISSMPMEDMASQLFLININGKNAFAPVERFNARDIGTGGGASGGYSAGGNGSGGNGHPLIPGGYIFFHYNIAGSAEGVKAFTDSIRKWCILHDALPPYLAVDQEGGDVQRLRGVAPKLPSARQVSYAMTEDEAARLYAAQGAFMRAMGFHLNLAPVAEAINGRNCDVLSTRSYGGTEEAIRFCTVCAASYKGQGISCAMKHFPGNAATDPHTGKSEALIPEEELEKEILPFMHLIRGGIEAVVMSHIRVNGLPPACLSRYWVERIRGEGFGGLVISDDIFMAAVADGYKAGDAALKALEAGVDVIMLSEKRFGTLLIPIIKRMQEDSAFFLHVKESCFKVMLFKLHHGILTMESIK